MPDTRRAVIEQLATLRRRDADEIQAEVDAGAYCDSILLLKAGVKAARALGFRLKPEANDARHFKTIESLVAYLDARRAHEAA